LRLPELTARHRLVLIVGGVLIAFGIWALIVWLAEPYDWNSIGTGHDARPYWTALFADPYATSRVGDHNAYLYSPAFLQLISPLRALPWQAFLAGWALVMMAAALFLVGPVLLGPVLVLVLPELLGGNITLLLALAVVAGFRWPATWSFVLLTKVTPGIGLLWFAVRREWRQLAIAIGATLAVVAGSFVLAPDGVWRQWIDELAGNANAPITSGSLPISLVARLPFAVLLIVWGARTDRRWTLPVGCLLALPVIWYGSLSLLVAVIPLAAGAPIRRHWDGALASLRGWWTNRRISAAARRQAQRT
jgi:Glycosyltransferase family 87